MPDVASQIGYWDGVAAVKRFSHPLRAEWLARHLKDPDKQARVLDYGCGYGRTIGELSLAGYERVLGIDFSSGMLERCHSEQPKVRLIRNDGRSVPLLADSMDAVLMFAVLTCIPDSTQQQDQVAEIERVLRPGGLLYLSDLLVNHDQRNRERYERFARAFGCYGVFELPEGVVVRHHRREWIDTLTKSFARLEFEELEVVTMNGNPSAAFQYLGRKSFR